MRAADIEIPKPCHEAWDAMTPTQRGRHCEACRQTVHDLSSMTERQAKKLLSSGEDVCISYTENADGSVELRPCALVPLTSLTRRLPRVAAAGLTLALAACAPHGEAPSLDAEQDKAPASLRYTPFIPEAEPCESAPPVVEEPPMVETPVPTEVDEPRRPRMGKPIMRPHEPTKGKFKRNPA